MNLLRGFFVSQPTQTDQEYTISLVDEILQGKATPICISRLKDLSKNYSLEISEKGGIPPLVKIYGDFLFSSQEVVADILSIFAELLRTENMKKSRNATLLLQCDDTIPNLVRSLDDKDIQIQLAAMHVLMMIATLQPQLFQDALNVHQNQMVRLFGSISDSNDQISNKFVTSLPMIINNNADFQCVVCFYALEALVKRINRNRPEFLFAILSILKNNQINQKYFVKNGYLKSIENMVKTPDQKILDLFLSLLSDENQIKLVQENLEQTSIINYLCDNIIRGVLRPTNIRLLSICIQNDHILSSKINEKLGDFVRLCLDSNLNELYQLFESYLYQSEENAHFLNKTILENNSGFSENFLNLCSFSILVAPSCKQDFVDIFKALLIDVRLRETVASMFHFFFCICWKSKDNCDMLCERMPVLIQLQIDDNILGDIKSNLKLLFAEILLFSGHNKANIDVISATIIPNELILALNQMIFDEETKFGQFQKSFVEYVCQNASKLTLNSIKSDVSNDDSIQEKIDELTKLNDTEISKLNEKINELTNKLMEKEEMISILDEESNKKSKEIEQINENNKIEKEDFDEQINKLKEQINKKEQEQLSKENDFIQSKANELQKEDEVNSELIEQISILKEENQALKQKINELTENQQQIELNNSLKEQNEKNEEIQEKNEFKEKIDNLETEVSTLKQEIISKDETKVELDYKIDNLTAEISGLKENNESLQAQNISSTNKVNELLQQLDETKERLSSLYQKEIDEKSNSISSLETQNEQLRSKIEKKSIETTEMIEKFNREISSLRKQQQNQQETNSYENNNELEIESLNNQINSLKNDYSLQKERFEKEKKNLSESFMKLQSEKDKLEDDCNSLLEVKKKLLEEKEKQENEGKELTLKNDELQQQIKDIEINDSQKMEAITILNEAEKEKLALEIKALTMELENSRRNEKICEKENNDLKKKFDEFTVSFVSIEKFDQLKKENLELSAKLSELMSKSNDNNEENSLIKENKVLIAKCEALRNENKNLISNEQNLKNQINDLLKKFQNINSSATEKRENNDIETTQNETENLTIEQLKKEIEDKNQEIARIQNNLFEHQEEEKKVNSQKDELIEDLKKQYLQNISEFENKNKELTEEMSEIGKQLERTKNSLKEEKRNRSQNDKIAAELRKTNSDLLAQIEIMKSQAEELQELTQQQDFIQYRNNSEEGNENNNEKSLNKEANNDSDQENENSLKSQIISLNDQIEALREELARAKSELFNMKDVEKENEKLRSELEKQKSLTSTQKESHENLIAKQRKLIDDLKIQNQKLEETALSTPPSNNRNKKNEDEVNNESKSQKIFMKEFKKQQKKAQEIESENLKLRDEIKNRTSEFRKTSQESALRIEDLKKKFDKVCKEKNQLSQKLNELQFNSARNTINSLSILNDNKNDDIIAINNMNNNNVDESVDEIRIRKSLQLLQAQNSALKAENVQLKNAPDKILLSALQSDKKSLEHQVTQLSSEVKELRKQMDEFSSSMIMKSDKTTAAASNRTQGQNSIGFGETDQDEQLMKEIEILKRDNENQSHTISDLQMLLSGQSVLSSDFVLNNINNNNINNNKNFHDNTNKNKSNNFGGIFSPGSPSTHGIEGEILKAQKKEFKAIEKENRKLNKENMELKRMIRQTKNPSLSPLANKYIEKSSLAKGGDAEINTHTRSSPSKKSLSSKSKALYSPKRENKSSFRQSKKPATNERYNYIDEDQVFVDSIDFMNNNNYNNKNKGFNAHNNNNNNNNSYMMNNIDKNLANVNGFYKESVGNEIDTDGLVYSPARFIGGSSPSDEDHKRALRVIGKLWFDQHQQGI